MVILQYSPRRNAFTSGEHKNRDRWTLQVRLMLQAHIMMDQPAPQELRDA